MWVNIQVFLTLLIFFIADEVKSLLIAILFSVIVLAVGVIMTIKVGMNPEDENYHSEKGRNMSRLIWIYGVILTFCIVISIVFVFFN